MQNIKQITSTMKNINTFCKEKQGLIIGKHVYPVVIHKEAKFSLVYMEEKNPDFFYMKACGQNIVKGFLENKTNIVSCIPYVVGEECFYCILMCDNIDVNTNKDNLQSAESIKQDSLQSTEAVTINQIPKEVIATTADVQLLGEIATTNTPSVPSQDILVNANEIKKETTGKEVMEVVKSNDTQTQDYQEGQWKKGRRK